MGGSLQVFQVKCGVHLFSFCVCYVAVLFRADEPTDIWQRLKIMKLLCSFSSRLLLPRYVQEDMVCWMVSGEQESGLVKLQDEVVPAWSIRCVMVEAVLLLPFSICCLPYFLHT